MADSRKCREAKETPYVANGAAGEEGPLKSARIAEEYRTRVGRLSTYRMWPVDRSQRLYREFRFQMRDYDRRRRTVSA